MSNFAEGVDLKVADKYRVPPPIPLPRDVISLVCSDHYKQLAAAADPETEYNFNLERNVIQKIDEWQRVHEQTEHDRQEGLRARDIERRQLIEQQQKQLLNQVSYPSTEDLSSDAEETTTTTTGDAKCQEGDSSEKPKVAEVPLATTARRIQTDFSTILQPTVVPEYTQSGGAGQKAPSSITEDGSSNSRSSNFMPLSNSQSRGNGINYSDWESDNYSPFDRMELKSINDLDILAQVLQKTQLNGNKEETKPLEESPPPPSPPSSPVAAATAVETAIASVVELNQESSSHQWLSNSHSPPANSAETFTTFPNYSQATNTMVTSSSQDYGQQQQHYSYYSGNPHHHHYPSNIPPTYSNNYVPQYSANYPYPTTTSSPMQHPMASAYFTAATEEQVPVEITSSSGSLLRSRSKSVPDIVNELEQEVKASEQRRRVRMYSQSGKGVNGGGEEEEEDEEEDVTAAAAQQQGKGVFERLPDKSKELALRISKMGFAVNVVATVVQQLGDDDKKVRIHRHMKKL